MHVPPLRMYAPTAWTPGARVVLTYVTNDPNANQASGVVSWCNGEPGWRQNVMRIHLTVHTDGRRAVMHQFDLLVPSKLVV